MKSESEIDRLVEVDADLLLDAGLVAHDLAGGDAAHGDLALAGAEVLHGEAGDVRGDVFDVLGAALAQRLFGRGRDRERHVEQRLLALAGGDGDLLGHRRFRASTWAFFGSAERDINCLCRRAKYGDAPRLDGGRTSARTTIGVATVRSRSSRSWSPSSFDW